mgnify:CR=1 FL=1
MNKFRKKPIFIVPLILLFLLFALCGRNSQKPPYARRPGKNEMMSLNTYLVEKDRERIISYIERKSLSARETPSGLWYMISEPGTGDFLRDKDQITIEYECTLLDGTVCYSSEISGPKKITLGRTVIEPGLDEGLRMLKPGGKALFILPPFLAWGLHGDDNKIPPRAVIVYNIHVLR